MKHDFSKSFRLSQTADYQALFSSKDKATSSLFIVVHRKNTVGHARLGLRLSKKKISLASTRNRIKRLVRESFRSTSLAPVDVLVLARYGLADKDNSVIFSQLSYLWKTINTYYTQ